MPSNDMWPLLYVTTVICYYIILYHIFVYYIIVKCIIFYYISSYHIISYYTHVILYYMYYMYMYLSTHHQQSYNIIQCNKYTITILWIYQPVWTTIASELLYQVTQLCNSGKKRTQDLQGIHPANFAQFHGSSCKVSSGEGLQCSRLWDDSSIPWFQISKVARFQGSRVSRINVSRALGFSIEKNKVASFRV